MNFLENSQFYKFLSLAILVFIFSGNGFGQAKDSEREIGLDLIVVNYYGRSVSSLKVEDIDVFVNKTKQEIISFEQKDEPISIGILVDVSGSMENKLDPAKFGLVEFLHKSNPNNEYFMVAFNDEVTELLDYTVNSKDIFEKMKFISSTPAKANTALYDAIAFGQEKLEKAKYKKHVLLVVGDGQDNKSENSFREIVKKMEKNDAFIYSMGFMSIQISSSLARTNPILASVLAKTNLDELAKITAGKALYPINSNEAKQVGRIMAEELRSHYRIKFKLDVESHKRLKKKTKGLKVKIKLKKKKIIYTNDEGKKKSVKLLTRYREKIFLKNLLDN